MEEATAVCDRILIIDNGKIIENGVPAELIRKYVGEEVLEVEYDENVVKTLKQELPGAEMDVYGEQVHVFLNQPHGVFENVVKKFPDKAMTIRNANLEDVFLKLTGRQLRESVGFPA
jgi:lipooligosaccharide transport system ATP-binding protein